MRLLVAALLSVSAAFWLSVFNDREGGVTLILLRHAPGWPIDTYGETPSQVGHILVRGNENGVMGEDLARWNARYCLIATRQGTVPMCSLAVYS